MKSFRSKDPATTTVALELVLAGIVMSRQHRMMEAPILKSFDSIECFPEKRKSAKKSGSIGEYSSSEQALIARADSTAFTQLEDCSLETS